MEIIIHIMSSKTQYFNFILLAQYFNFILFEPGWQDGNGMLILKKKKKSEPILHKVIHIQKNKMSDRPQHHMAKKKSLQCMFPLAIIFKLQVT